jgi:hypothetical protein
MYYQYDTLKVERLVNDSKTNIAFLSAARVDLAQYAALAIEEHLALTTHLYREAVLGIGKDLSAGIKGLTAVMEYFSSNGQVENLPLSVYVLPTPLFILLDVLTTSLARYKD